MKNVKLRLGIVKCKDYSLLYNLNDKIYDSIKTPIDMRAEEQDNDIWFSDQDFSDLLNCSPNIIIIKELWVPEDMRNQGIASKILLEIEKTFGKNSLVFAYVGVSKTEYPTIKYKYGNNSIVEDGRILIDSTNIIKHNLRFLINREYVEVSGYTNSSLDRSIVLLDGPLGHIAKQYMEASIVLKNAHGFQKITQIYRDLFYHTIAMGEDENISMWPWVEDGESKLCPTLHPEMEELIKEKNPYWYSGHISDPTTESNVDSFDSLKKAFIASYRRIGGAEIHFNNMVEDSPKPYDVYIKMTGDNQIAPTDDFDDASIDYYDEFLCNKNSDFVLMTGFVLTTDGMWNKEKWLYDSKNARVIDWIHIPEESVVAYVGHIDSVASELVK